MALAFLVAGAGAVVATLWRVGDSEAADVAERFYRQLGPGGSAAEALARSQRGSSGGGRDQLGRYAVWGTGERNTSAIVRANGVRP